MNGTKDVYQMITDRMIKALENGTVPWRRPWTIQTGGIPRSLSTQKAYRGVNTWLLTMTAMDEGYSSPWWGTFFRIKELGGKVRKGQHGTRVVWWKQITKPDPEDPSKTVSFLIGKTDVVFNACQCEGLPDVYFPVIGEAVAAVAEPQAILDEYITARGPEVFHAPQGRAYYQPGPDVLTLPTRAQFETAAEYYSTAFHEVGHSTGHPKRLNRKGITVWDGFGSHGYGREELVAEMTAAMLCELTGVSTDGTFQNSAAYLASWIKTIKGDIKMVSQAASQAQAAVDYILGNEMEAEADSQVREMAVA